MSVVLKKFTNFNRKSATCFLNLNNTVHRSNFSDDPKFILHSDLPDVDIPNISIPEYVFSRSDKWPQNIATECAVTGRRYTFDEKRIKTNNLSKNLRKKLKLEKGDVVAVLLPNCPEFSLSVLGALKAGLIVTTLNPIYTPDEISRQLKDSDTKVLITLGDFFPLAQKSVSLIQKTLPILRIKTVQGESTPDGGIDFNEFLEHCDYPDIPPPKPDQIAFLPYSSGTTGLPKGVKLTHFNIVANICQFNDKRIGVLKDTTGDHFDTLPCVLPKFHIYGLVANTLHPLEKGTKTVSLPKFTPELYLQTLRKYKPDSLFVAPPIVLFLAGHPSVKTEDLQSVRSLVCGAAPLGKLDEERFLKKAQKPIIIYQGYGLTETSPLVSTTRPDLLELPACSGSIGRPVSKTMLKIVNPDDEDLKALGPNEQGELLVKGPQVMQGYHNRPEETKNAFTKDGWLRTGDMMKISDDGLLIVGDRLKELIKVKGFQVPPAELEEIIRHFPEVDDAAVIGIPDVKQGEAPKAFIVEKPGKKVDLKKLQEFVSSKVAPYKQLKGGIEVIDTIPKNASGKILRRELKDKYVKQ